MTKIFNSLWENKYKEQRSDRRTTLLGAVIISVMIFVIYLTVFVFFSVEVSGASMQSTLFDGDTLIVNKTVTADYGDVVIINKKGKTDYWVVKRVIGLGGDTVEIKNDGCVYLNGEKLEEDYLDDFQTTKLNLGEYGYEKWVLQDNEIFYLGDNRLNSTDSRIAGPCKTSDVVGVVENWSISIKNLLRDFSDWFKGLF